MLFRNRIFVNKVAAFKWNFHLKVNIYCPRFIFTELYVYNVKVLHV